MGKRKTEKPPVPYVVIGVFGGVADVEEKSSGCEVRIRDYDNADEGDETEWGTDDVVEAETEGVDNG